MDLPIETERLWLRKYEDKDLADILEYSSDADFWLARNLDWPVSEEGVKEYWQAQRNVDPSADPEWLSLVVELKAEEKVIGHVGIGVVGTGEHRQGGSHDIRKRDDPDHEHRAPDLGAGRRRHK
jgi:RimJ/RimL family protein N-acetyltransferase